MRLQPDSPRRSDEDRRYFPEWKDHLAEIGDELEADHNSYLAGGYAEEFGYHAQAGASRGVPVLDGDPPEDCAEWRGEAAATHPGYPITPRPVTVDGELNTSRDTAIHEPPAPAGSHEETAPETAPTQEHHGTFVRITDRPYEQLRHHATRRVGAIFTRIVAGLTSAQWELSRRR
jgi:hypothetical protein